MRTILRLLVLGCAATGSLALAGTALAKTPQLLVSGSQSTAASAETVIEVKEVKEDAAPLRIAIYLPIGYTANITQAAGTQIGTVNADLQALAISPDAIIQAEGTVLTAAPATYVTNTCSPGTHARSEEHTSELQSRQYLVCRLLLEKKKKNILHSANLKKTKTTTTN